MSKKTTQEPPVELTMEDIYNMLMYDIEPDLMTSSLPELDAIYADETDEEREARADRYAEAFRECSRRLDGVLSVWMDEFLGCRDDLLKKLRSKAGEEDAEKLSDIEDSLGNL